MRLAVALPSLPPGSPVRRAQESAVVALGERGHEVEVFAEHDRLGEGGIGDARGLAEGPEIPLFHYLRLAERHRSEPFDTALHPFGRDAHLYQGVFWCARTLPGLLWVMDSGLHHFVLGDLGPRGLWPAYRRALAAGAAAAGEAAGGEEHRATEDVADTVLDLVAAGWGTGLLFRRHDLVTWLAADQPRVAAITVPLGRELRPWLADGVVGTAPLPAPADTVGLAAAEPHPDTWERWKRRAPRVLLASFELASPTMAFRVLRSIRELCPGARLRVCAPRVLVPGLLGPQASRLGLEVDWVCDARPPEMSRQVGEADVVAWLRADPVAEDRLWQLEALAAGKVVFTLRVPHYEDLTPGAVIPVEPGRALDAGVCRSLAALFADDALRRGVREAGRLLASASPTAVDSARSLEHQLEKTAAAGPPALRNLSAATWETVGREIGDKAVPPGAEEHVRRAVTSCLPLPGGGGIR